MKQRLSPPCSNPNIFGKFTVCKWITHVISITKQVKLEIYFYRSAIYQENRLDICRFTGLHGFFELADIRDWADWIRDMIISQKRSQHVESGQPINLWIGFKCRKVMQPSSYLRCNNDHYWTCLSATCFSSHRLVFVFNKGRKPLFHHLVDVSKLWIIKNAPTGYYDL